MKVLSSLVCSLLACACGGGGSGSQDPAQDVAPDIQNVLETPGESSFPDADLSPDTGPDLPPDPAYMHVPPAQPVKIKDDPFQEDWVVMYRTIDKLPDLDVRSLAVVRQALWAGTGTGLYRYDFPPAATDKFEKVELPGPGGAVVDLAGSTPPSSPLIVAFQDHVVMVPPPGGGDAVSIAVPDAKVRAVEIDTFHLYIGTESAVLIHDPAGNQTANVALAGVRDITSGGSKAFVATGTGVAVLEDGTVTAKLTAASGHLDDDDVRAVYFDPSTGTVHAASATGLAEIDFQTGKSKAIRQAGKGGLPSGDLTAVFASGPLVVMGHGRGATVASEGFDDPDHYVSGRWLPDDHVTAVTAGIDGSRWFGTPAGVSRVRLRPQTIAAKAAQLHKELDSHYWRMDGFVSPGASLDDAWNPTKWSVDDSDNDGLWTQMMIGAWCYAYAVTRDEQFYKAARKAMDTMFLQIDIPAVDFEKKGMGRGFVTRSLVRDDEGAYFENKKTQANWHPVKWKGHDYYWKDDTSSDETTGHFFGYPLFYDLCAKDGKERADVADHAGALAGYILKNGFRLIDLDGQETTWGHWQPERIGIAVDGLTKCAEKTGNIEWCVEAFAGGGWLNAAEILGHMLAAWHMTGDQKFYDAYDKLVTEHRYDEVVKFSENVMTVVAPPTANHSDHELAMLAFATLIRYEPNDDRRAKWIDSLLGFYTYEIPERQPLWTAFVAMAVAGQAHVEEGVRSLREMPADLRGWGVDNSHRKDAVVIGKDRFGQPQFDTVFPYDEIRTMWWNGNPYRVKEGGNGKGTEGPMAFLLAYWAQRYAGILE